MAMASRMFVVRRGFGSFCAFLCSLMRHCLGDCWQCRESGKVVMLGVGRRRTSIRKEFKWSICWEINDRGEEPIDKNRITGALYERSKTQKKEGQSQI